MVRMRTPRYDKSGLRKGTWTPEEDKKLVDYVTRYGHWNWRLLPKFAGLARCGKSCRLRWLNYLRPDLKRGNYTQEEDETIVKLHRRLVNRWSAIAAQIPGRTDNEIKNHWHTSLKKRFQQNSVKESQVSKSKDQAPEEPITANNTIGPFPATSQFTHSSPFSHHSSSSESSSTISIEHSTDNILVLEDGFAFVDHAADTFPMSGSFWLDPYMLGISYVPSEPEYFSPILDAELWSHDNY